MALAPQQPEQHATVVWLPSPNFPTSCLLHQYPPNTERCLCPTTPKPRSKLSKQSGKPAFPARIWRRSTPTHHKPRTNLSGTTAHLEQLPGLHGARQLRSALEMEHRGSGDRKRSLNHGEVTGPRAADSSSQVVPSRSTGSGNRNVMTGGLAHHIESPRSPGQTLRQRTNVPLWATDVFPTGKPIP